MALTLHGNDRPATVHVPSGLLPTPSCPNAFHPQQSTDPVTSTPQACAPEALAVRERNCG